MSVEEWTAYQLQLMKARATKFINFRQQKILPAQHGLLPKDIDLCLGFGLLRHGYDETLPGELSASVFVPFNKCLTHCMENGVHRNREQCEICDSISDLTKHSALCAGHPEACTTCKSFYNLLKYHLVTCYTCDMHLCTKLKLKLLKYHSTEEDGLIELWPKIQQYIARLFPAIVDECRTSEELYINYSKPRGKQVELRYPSVFDSVSMTPPMSPALVARGPDNSPTTSTSQARGQDGGVRPRHSYEFDNDMYHLQRTFDMSVGLNSPVSVLPSYGGGATGGDVFMSTDSIPSSLSLNSLETKLKPKDGYGSVIMGEPRQLKQLAEHWANLKDRLESSKNFRTEVDGIVLQGTNSGMHTVAGQYKKNEQWRKITYVGAGVAGKCYLAVDINTEAQFAVKKIDLLKYQPDELVLWSELEHPNLVKLYGAMRVKHKVYIFSEFYAAGNMAEFIESHRMLDQWLSLWFLSQLLDALMYLKKKDILHEDIKADNIFLKPDSYKVGLGDFGLSRKGRCPPKEKPVGGQHHWSPEKAKSEGHGHPADVWAANCAFIHMLSGQPPWRKRFSDIVHLHFKIASESPPVDDIPENLLTVVDSMIRKAWLLNQDERPTAAELLQEECFQIIYGGYDRTEPIFRSHIPEVEEEDMDFDAIELSESQSIDYLLEGMDDKEYALEYINQLCATIDSDDPDGVKLGSASGSGGAILRRQYSIKVPPMESIREDPTSETEDASLNGSQKNILLRRDRPAISPLILPTRSSTPALDRRNSWGRSNTSPSPSTAPAEPALTSKRETLRKRETSPAIILSSCEEPEALMGEKDIFDLNPGTSGYVTGSYMTDDDGGMSLNFQSSEASGYGDISSYHGSTLYDPSHQWLGSGAAWNGEAAAYAPSSYPSSANALVENKMGHIALKPDTSATSLGAPVEEKFDLSSSLQMLKESLPSSLDPRSILTIVNGLTYITTTDVLIRGTETWQEIIEQQMPIINSWNIEDYTYYIDLEKGEAVDLNDVVPKEKTNVYVYPTKDQSTWQVKNGQIRYSQFN